MDSLTINPQEEKNRIINFLKTVFRQQKIDKAVIGLSGGVDSAVALYLLKEVLKPENIFVCHLYYFRPHTALVDKILVSTKIPKKNIKFASIKTTVDRLHCLKFDRWHERKGSRQRADEQSKCESNPGGKETRDRICQILKGNITVRTRMIILFDLAKRIGGLVCGTENKSEKLLGYFTRFGDAASDIEPINSLYKTQVLKLAEYLKVPKEIIGQKPTAGLWQGQTDEDELGFTYKEADQVLNLYFDKKLSLEEIKKQGYKNVRKIIDRVKNNEFKHKTPYCINTI